MARIAAVACLLALAACTRVQSNVESYSALPADFRGRSVAVLAFQEAANRSLEFKSHKAKLEARFRGEGFTIAPPGTADYLAFFGYSIDEGREVLTTYSSTGSRATPARTPWAP